MFKLLDGQTLDQQAVADMRTRSHVVVSQSEVLLQRAAYLPREDQLLIELSVRFQYSQRKVAGLIGVPHGTVARRLKRLGALLSDPLVVRLLDGPWPLERTDRDIAIGYFLHRQSLRELSVIHQLPLPQIGQRLQFVRGWFRGASVKGKAE